MNEDLTPGTAPATAASTKKPRMEWLDAMRGFTMIMVVAYHVACGFAIPLKQSASLPFLVLFRMPLFFFISGFLAYKSGYVWNGRGMLRMLGKKTRIQIVPTVVFFYIALVLLKPSFWPGFEFEIHNPTKFGYWFTWSLLHMFVLYYLFCYLEDRLALRHFRWLPIALLWIAAVCVYETQFMPRDFSWHKLDWVRTWSLNQTFLFFHFFVAGNIVRRYWTKAERLMDSRGFFIVCLALMFLCSVEYLKWHNLRLYWANLPRTTAMYATLLVVFMTFRYYRDHFTKAHRAGRWLQFIGMRTLDIYLIHFLFTPKLPVVGEFIARFRGNFVLEVSVTLLYAAVVIAFCLLLSAVIRVSPFLKKYLFGRG